MKNNQMNFSLRSLLCHPEHKRSLRPKVRRVFMLFVVIIFFSCGNEKEKDLSAELQDMKDTVADIPAKTEEDFISLLKGISIANINPVGLPDGKISNGVNQFIHPEKGLWIINSSGAMPNMTNTTQVDKNFPVDFANVKNEELPKVNCDSKSFWTKEGCYVQEINTFKEENLPAGKAGIWTYCGLSTEDEAKVSELAQTISYTVINTSLYARYYFSLMDGKWYLTFVDLRKPCEA